jgi:hypothetical protein
MQTKMPPNDLKTIKTISAQYKPQNVEQSIAANCPAVIQVR